MQFPKEYLVAVAVALSMNLNCYFAVLKMSKAFK